MLPIARRWLARFGPFCMALVFVFALYSPTISLPYFWDDVPHFFFSTEKTLAQIWRGTPDSHYYRPLIFSLYRILFQTLPMGATDIPHILALLAHAVTCGLTGKLAAWLFVRGAGKLAWQNSVVEWLAALLYAVCPFGALPLPHFAAAMHPLVLLLTVSGVVATLWHVRSSNMIGLAWAVIASLLAPYAHEYGVMAGTLIALAVIAYDQGYSRRHWRRVSLFPILSALFVPVFLLSSRKHDAAGLPLLFSTLFQGQGNDLFANVTFFLQALTYPFQPLATPLFERWGWWDFAAIWFVSGVSSLGVGWLLWRGRCAPLLVFGVSWCVLGMLPSVLALPFNYIFVSQRLLYFPSLGAAILWAAVLTVVARDFKGWVAKITSLAVLIVFVVGLPIAYIQRSVKLHVLTLSAVDQLNEVARQYPVNKHLIVNAINWTAYRTRWYPLGTDGVSVLADYVVTPQVIYINTGIWLDAVVATFGDLRPDIPLYYTSIANEKVNEMGFQRLVAEALSFDHVWLTTYSEDKIEVHEVGHASAYLDQQPEIYQANFDNAVFVVNSNAVVHHDSVTLALDWVYIGPNQQATIFRHVLDCAGNLVANESGHALGGMLPLSEVESRVRIYDIREIPLSTPSLDGCYQIGVGLFRDDGSRVSVFASDGSEYPDSVVFLSK